MSEHRKLADPLTAYRIGDAMGEYPVFSPEGAARVNARWHRMGDRVIYASEHYATAMLEKLVHWQGSLPGEQHYIEITLPAGISYEVFNPDKMPGWRNVSGREAAEFGHRWCASRRSALLIVPSAIAPVERNVLINADHAEFHRIRCGLETPIWWDERLFRQT